MDFGLNIQHWEFASLEVVDRVIVNMDKNKMPIGIFLDLSKAFDTLIHDICFQKLKFYGFHRTALTLMESYLTVHIKAICSDG